eukprot:TRINITY_DN5166_c0_g1_i4.p1 TRINITY_DN5166_c0_g1~~TRINITY_DN5166_c0_g1_i4.p1  ORF type:complete len:170 (+),score=21.42 TRINITY_DN5166_c0_g1_i4:111-620(+)
MPSHDLPLSAISSSIVDLWMISNFQTQMMQAKMLQNRVQYLQRMVDHKQRRLDHFRTRDAEYILFVIRSAFGEDLKKSFAGQQSRRKSYGKKMWHDLDIIDWMRTSSLGIFKECKSLFKLTIEKEEQLKMIFPDLLRKDYGEGDHAFISKKRIGSTSITCIMQRMEMVK